MYTNIMMLKSLIFSALINLLFQNHLKQNKQAGGSPVRKETTENENQTQIKTKEKQ